jgi:hypothetical protein
MATTSPDITDRDPNDAVAWSTTRAQSARPDGRGPTADGAQGCGSLLGGAVAAPLFIGLPPIQAAMRTSRA